MNKKPDIIIVGSAGAGSTVAALSGIHGTPDIVVVDNVVDLKTAEQSPFENPNKTYIIEKLPEFPVEVSLKDVNKHPFDKFINGPRKRRKR